MDFSLWTAAPRPWNDILESARYAERTGWHGIWVADHFMQNGDDGIDAPVHECLALLAALAASTERIRLGSMVIGNTYRHPAVLANQVATIDQIAGGGRLVLGLGAGWQINEHEAYGIDLPAPKQRLARFEEACQVIKSLLTQSRTDFDGTYYQLRGAPLEPKPAALPLLIGAQGEKVALRIVATHADEWNHWGLPDLAAQKGEVFRAHCDEIGRDPATVRRSTQAMFEVIDAGDSEAAGRRDALIAQGRPVVMGSAEELRDTLGRYAEAGIDELLIPDMALGDDAQRRVDALERLRTEVLSPTP
ncbi:TIGR03560 family F420-dependent LLM class oxidoreductase [Pseudonocardia spinosispora]|uniref:TIGR03560 family F420-dependent LLM class oxidoreductase n=1 Tax=Pseudonocardia spinosispora TaxID=103441 RepID=UPI0003F9DA85|nr:TIGR03560 family F420-dependent LLM class oxidoreductase [Pseudonocardia spinosispora]